MTMIRTSSRFLLHFTLLLFSFRYCKAFSIPSHAIIAAPTTASQGTNIGDKKDEEQLQQPPRQRQRVVVIGAGVGGLATAARIASSFPPPFEAPEVVVLEKNGRRQLGGRCGSFDVTLEQGTFRHERGPSLLLLKEEYERLFADCGNVNVESDRCNSNTDGADDKTPTPISAAQSYGLEMKQCIPAYQVVFEDGLTIPLGFPRSKCSQGLSLEEIKQIQILEQESILKLNALEPDGFNKWQAYLDTCSAYLNCGLPNFIEERLDIMSFPSFLYEALRDNLQRWPLKPHATMLSSLFTSSKMIALASFQDLYVGLEPYANPNQIGGGVLRKSAPAVFGLLAALELHPTNEKAGVFAPVGGFRQVAESMHELCVDRNVNIRFDTPVTAVTEEGVHFVGKDGNEEEGFIPADLIICNADVPFATETIAKKLGKSPTQLHQETYDWNDKFDYSTGVIAFHWSVSQRLDALNTHNVFMSADTIQDAEKSWAVLRGDDDLIDDNASCVSMRGKPFNFYVHRAGMTDDSACPPGCDSIMVLVPCPTLVRSNDLASLPRDEAMEVYKAQFGEDYVEDVRSAVLERLSVLNGLENLQDAILDEVVDTPASYADYYNVGAGVPFGLSHGLGQLSLTRPAAECKSYNNMLFVGASSRPGNGVPLVLIGSRQVAKKAVEKLKSMITQEY